jgi:chemotaxis response regulator CheB
VDDPAGVRRAISNALGCDPEIEVAGTAADPAKRATRFWS